MRFELIDRAKKDFPVQRLCRVAYSVDADQPIQLIVITVHGDPDHGVHPAWVGHDGQHDVVPVSYH